MPKSASSASQRNGRNRQNARGEQHGRANEQQRNNLCHATNRSRRGFSAVVPVAKQRRKQRKSQGDTIWQQTVASAVGCTTVDTGQRSRVM